MKSIFTLLAVIGFAQFAAADIPLPHNANHQTESRSVTYSGPRAEAKWNVIQSEVIPGSSSGWSGENESYKVERSEDGLVQTVCSKKVNFRTNAEPVYSCTKEKSLNGQALPVFLPPIRMG